MIKNNMLLAFSATLLLSTAVRLSAADKEAKRDSSSPKTEKLNDDDHTPAANEFGAEETDDVPDNPIDFNDALQAMKNATTTLNTALAQSQSITLQDSVSPYQVHTVVNNFLQKPDLKTPAHRNVAQLLASTAFTFKTFHADQPASSPSSCNSLVSSAPSSKRRFSIDTIMLLKEAQGHINSILENNDTVTKTEVIESKTSASSSSMSSSSSSSSTSNSSNKTSTGWGASFKNLPSSIYNTVTAGLPNRTPQPQVPTNKLTSSSTNQSRK